MPSLICIRRGTAALLTLLLLAARPAHAAEPPLIAWSAAQAQAAGVVTQRVQAGATAPGDLLLQGTVVLPPQATDMVSAPVPGVVQAIQVQRAQTVRAGQPIAQLMSHQLVEWQHEWVQAQAQARLAQSKLKRDEQLFAEGIIAEVRLTETRTQHQLAQVMLAERRETLQLAGYDPAREPNRRLSPLLVLKAPADATVMELLAVPGQRVDAGTPVARLARAGHLSLELQASAEQARLLRAGDTLAVDGCQTPARVTSIAPQLSATQAVMVLAEVTGREDCLRVNQYVQTRRVRAAQPQATLSVPAQAVVRQAGQAYVFVREAGGFRPSPVTLAPGGDAWQTVRQGLKDGAEIAVQGTAALKGAWLGLGAEANPPVAPARPAAPASAAPQAKPAAK